MSPRMLRFLSALRIFTDPKLFQEFMMTQKEEALKSDSLSHLLFETDEELVRRYLQGVFNCV